MEIVKLLLTDKRVGLSTSEHMIGEYINTTSNNIYQALAIDDVLVDAIEYGYVIIVLILLDDARSLQNTGIAEEILDVAISSDDPIIVAKILTIIHVISEETNRYTFSCARTSPKILRILLKDDRFDPSYNNGELYREVENSNPDEGREKEFDESVIELFQDKRFKAHMLRCDESFVYEYLVHLTERYPSFNTDSIFECAKGSPY